MASHGHRLISVVIPPLSWRWQGLLHFPMFILAARTFPESDPVAFRRWEPVRCWFALQVDVEGGEDSGA